VREARVLEVGRIGRPHGLRGEVAVFLSTDRMERAQPGAVLIARAASGDERELVIAQSRRHQERWLVRFEGVDDRHAAAALTGSVLYAAALESEGDELWVHELIGATVVDASGREIGSVVAIEANPAHDILVLDGGALVPSPFVVAVEGGRVRVDVPEGLLEL